jgi:hypothetical protein
VSPERTPLALLAIADEVIDEAARLRCWANDCVCDAVAQQPEKTKRIALVASVTKLTRLGFTALFSRS